jgi:chemotaxis protein methyltransferase CheR
MRDRQNLSLDQQSFDAIAALAYRESGLQLTPEKISMVQSRLRSRLNCLNLSDFKNYANFVCSDEGVEERRQMISALTTNVSHFFREKHHFDILATHLKAKLRGGKAQNPIRIWSAGCSNGQEVYSIAMHLLQELPELEQSDFRILGTDIDSKVVSFGKQGTYPERLVGGVPENLIRNYFHEDTEHGERSFTANEKLKSIAVFRELNLLANWSISRKLDAVFCRNVVIYFDGSTQNKLWPRFRSVLQPDGYLFLGHSERITHPESFGFENDGPTAYRAK